LPFHIMFARYVEQRGSGGAGLKESPVGFSITTGRPFSVCARRDAE